MQRTIIVVMLAMVAGPTYAHADEQAETKEIPRHLKYVLDPRPERLYEFGGQIELQPNMDKVVALGPEGKFSLIETWRSITKPEFARKLHRFVVIGFGDGMFVDDPPRGLSQISAPRYNDPSHRGVVGYTFPREMLLPKEQLVQNYDPQHCPILYPLYYQRSDEVPFRRIRKGAILVPLGTIRLRPYKTTALWDVLQLMDSMRLEIDRSSASSITIRPLSETDPPNMFHLAEALRRTLLFENAVPQLAVAGYE